MLNYILRRLIYMLPTLLIISLVAFFVVQLAPGDFLTKYKLNERISQETLQSIAKHLGLETPCEPLEWQWQGCLDRYWRWLKGVIWESQSTDPRTGQQWQVWSFQFSIDSNFPFVHGFPFIHWNPDFGFSFETNQPVATLFWERLPLTLLVTIPTFLFAWLISLPLGIYSATRQYSLGDNIFTLLGFAGLSIPNFFLALVLMYWLVISVIPTFCSWGWGFFCTGNAGASVGGLFTQAHMAGSPWPWDWTLTKWLDYLWHLWPAVLVIGSSSIASLMRVMRGQLLDILNSQYIMTARAKGLKESVVVYKHAVRNALNVMITIFGQSLPGLISGALITAIVLNFPTVERLFYDGLRAYDDYLVQTLLMFFAILLLLGNLLADIMLAWADPRIRYD
ncbi:MAG: ABC transporter permease [Candidatus Bipolaricaulota bacterium]|nr:ABC transporter permease [Candidatus Bipolaricaulota bacterium]